MTRRETAIQYYGELGVLAGEAYAAACAKAISLAKEQFEGRRKARNTHSTPI